MKHFILIALIILPFSVFAKEIEYWEAPIDSLRTIGENISKEKITPIILWYKDGNIYINSNYENFTVASDAVKNESSLLENSSLQLLLKQLGISDDKGDSEEWLNLKSLAIAIEYDDGSCKPCKQRESSLKELKFEKVISYKISSKTKELRKL